jgi:hypothetical protein
VRVQVRMIAVASRAVHVESASAPRSPEAERYEHDTNGGLGPHRRGSGQPRSAPCQETTGCQDYCGVAQAPAEAESGSRDDSRPATYEGRDRHHMIYLEGVARPQGERRRVGGPGSFHGSSRRSESMTDAPHDQKPRIRLTTLSHGAG